MNAETRYMAAYLIANKKTSTQDCDLFNACMKKMPKSYLSSRNISLTYSLFCHLRTMPDEILKQVCISEENM